MFLVFFHPDERDIKEHTHTHTRSIINFYILLIFNIFPSQLFHFYVQIVTKTNKQTNKQHARGNTERYSTPFRLIASTSIQRVMGEESKQQRESLFYISSPS